MSVDNIAGSGFAVADYRVHPALGGDSALARLRERLRKRDLRLMLDFVPNHTAPDHAWVEQYPEYYVAGSKDDLARNPKHYTALKVRGADRIFAHGRDPFVSAWPDTLQLNYGSAAMREAMAGELLRIAGQCDGVRCDMAMLVLPEVFKSTWGIEAVPFWPGVISRVRESMPGFYFMAEAYWDLEWTLQQQGFDACYDKRLYDRLREGKARSVRDHLRAEMDYQSRLARFLENHDEPRAAAAFPPAKHEAAAAVAFLAPGLRFFHDGQFEGRLKRISPHLGRAPEESVNEPTSAFYARLLAVLRKPALRNGDWMLVDCVPAGNDDGTSEAFIAQSWHDGKDSRILAVVNYSDQAARCWARLPFPELGGRVWVLEDLLGIDRYERDGLELQSRGLFLDVGAWKAHVFEVKPA